MSSRHPLDGAFQRVDRAEEHLRELQGEIDRLRQGYLDAANIHFDSDPPYRPRAFNPHSFHHPPIVSIILGEICYNLRSALDYLVFELVSLDCGTPPTHNTQFSIRDTPKKFASDETGHLKGLSVPHLAAIERFQPYKGCNWTRVLRDLSNPDKHRKLTDRGSSFTVDVITSDVGEPARPFARSIRKAKRDDGTEVQVELVGSFEIIVPVGVHPPDILIGESVEVVAEHLIPKVRDTLEAFKPEFQ